MSVAGFDIDGTLCRTAPGTDYEDPASILASCTPIAAAVRALQSAAADGHDIVLVTARGPLAREVTIQQAHDWLGAAAARVKVATRPTLIFDFSRMAAEKEVALRRLGVDVYVGDRPEDQEAALRAGARFVHADRVHAFGYAALRGELTSNPTSANADGLENRPVMPGHSLGKERAYASVVKGGDGQ